MKKFIFTLLALVAIGILSITTLRAVNDRPSLVTINDGLPKVIKTGPQELTSVTMVGVTTTGTLVTLNLWDAASNTYTSATKVWQYTTVFSSVSTAEIPVNVEFCKGIVAQVSVDSGAATITADYKRRALPNVVCP